MFFFTLAFFQNQGFGSLRQEGICEQPEFTEVDKWFEQIIDEPSGKKGLKEGY
jgi:hypothetical protein